jgi:hypothetical protein
MLQNQNKRKFPRAQYPCSLTLWQGSSFGTISSNTANIGAGGMLIHLDQGLMIGAKVEIEINFEKNKTFQCTGLVLRCQQNREFEDQKSQFSVAIVFEGLEESKVAYLKEIVEQLLVNEGQS